MPTAHEVLLSIQTGKTMDDPNRMRFANDEFYVKTPEEMALFKQDAGSSGAIPCLSPTAAIWNLDFKTYHFPQYEKPAEKTLDEVLAEQAQKGLEDRLEYIRLLRPDFSAANRKRTYRDRLVRELETIRSMGFPSYFLIVADFINWAKDNGIPVGPGRGSAAGSLVAYAIRITDIDPCHTICCSSVSSTRNEFPCPISTWTSASTGARK
jgi:DNA polymerase III subunit alpha